jgi:hypothetical protein
MNETTTGIEASSLEMMIPQRELNELPKLQRRAFIANSAIASTLMKGGIITAASLGLSSAMAAEIYYISGTNVVTGYYMIGKQQYAWVHSKVYNSLGLLKYHIISTYATDGSYSNRLRVIILGSNLNTLIVGDNAVVSSYSSTTTKVTFDQLLKDSNTQDWKEGELRRRNLQDASIILPAGATNIVDHTISEADSTDLVFKGTSYELNSVYYLAYRFHRITSQGAFMLAQQITVSGTRRTAIINALSDYKADLSTFRKTKTVTYSTLATTAGSAVAGFIANNKEEATRVAYWTMIFGIAGFLVGGIAASASWAAAANKVVRTCAGLLVLCEEYQTA